MFVVAELLFLGQVWEITSLPYSDSWSRPKAIIICVYFMYSADTGQLQQIASLVPASISVIRAAPLAPTTEKVGERASNEWLSSIPWVKSNLGLCEFLWMHIDILAWSRGCILFFFFTSFCTSDIHILWQMSCVSVLKSVNAIMGWAAMVETSAIASVMLSKAKKNLTFLYFIGGNSISDAYGWHMLIPFMSFRSFIILQNTNIKLSFKSKFITSV